MQEESNPHAWVRVLRRNNQLSCQEFQGFENTNIQAKLPSKSAWTREANRKAHQRVSSHLESTDCSSEDEKVYLGQSLQEANISPYGKKRIHSQVQTFHLIIQYQRAIVQGTIKTIISSIKKKTFSQIQTSHLIMQQHKLRVKDTVETITNSVKVRIALNKKGKLLSS